MTLLPRKPQESALGKTLVSLRQQSVSQYLDASLRVTSAGSSCLRFHSVEEERKASHSREKGVLVFFTAHRCKDFFSRASLFVMARRFICPPLFLFL